MRLRTMRFQIQCSMEEAFAQASVTKASRRRLPAPPAKNGECIPSREVERNRKQVGVLNRQSKYSLWQHQVDPSRLRRFFAQTMGNGNGPRQYVSYVREGNHLGVLQDGKSNARAMQLPNKQL